MIRTLATISIDNENHITTIQHEDSKYEQTVPTPKSQIRPERVSMLWNREVEQMEEYREKVFLKERARANYGKASSFAVN